MKETAVQQSSFEKTSYTDAALRSRAEQLVHVARIHLRRGNREGAITELELALREVARCANGQREAAVTELRRLGDRITPRQRTILGLVADGMRNREIAQTLYLSEKTIERELTSIYASLGVSSRTGALRAAGRFSRSS